MPSVANCAHCGAEFTAQRVTRRHCSPACRLRALRQRRRDLKARQVETVGAARATLEGNGEFPHKAIGTDRKEPARTLDKSRDYAEIHGDDRGRAYEQDGHYFLADGREADRG